MRGRREVAHLGRMKPTRDSSSTAWSRDRNEHVEIARNVLQLKECEISPATMKTMRRKGDGTVGGTLVKRVEKCSLFTVGLALELRLISEENMSLTAVGSKYKVRVKNLNKKTEEKELNRLTVL